MAFTLPERIRWSVVLLIWCALITAGPVAADARTLKNSSNCSGAR
jgi:hypothetical protein